MNPTKTQKKGKSSTSNFIIICIFFQIIAIVGCGYLLYSSNEKYNKLVEVESSNFDTFQKWTSKSNQNFMRLFEVLETTDKHKIDSLHSNWLAVNKDIDEYISNLRMSSSLNILNDTLFQAMMAHRLTYFNNVDKFIRIRQTASNASGQYFFEDLKPSFMAFQDNLGDFVQYYQEHINRNNNAIYQSSIKSLWGVIFVGLMPIVGLTLLLTLSFVYLLWFVNKLDFVNN